MIDRYCRHCGFTIYPVITHKKANDRGFCHSVCMRLYEAEKEFTLRMEEKRATANG